MTRVAAAALLAMALLAGAFLRFDALGEPSYWLDEILGETLTDAAMSQPWWHWLTGVDHEHGPLYYAAQFASRIAGRDEAAGRLPAVIFGLCAIPVVWLASRSTLASTIGALLLATSPLHVYYSREARPYALLMLLSAVLIVALLRERRWWFVVAIVALLYTSLTAAPVIAAAAIAAALRREWKLASLAAFATALAPLLYRGASTPVGDFPAFDLALLAKVLRVLTVSALGDDGGERTALAILIFAVIGAVVSDVRDRAVLIAMAMLPAVFAVAALWFHGHFFAPRYVAGSLIGFLVLAGTGIAACAEWIARRWAPAPAIAIAILIAIPAWRNARREPFQKLDWRMIGATLRDRARPGDVIATAQPYSYLSLKYYLRDLPPSVDFVLLDTIPAAEKWTGSAPAAWLVHSGYSTDVSHWMCRYPVLLASPLEGFRLHYAPSSKGFLTDRAGPGERRMLARGLGVRGYTMQMGPEDDLLLGAGWAGAEGSFRWANARRATVIVPREGHTIRFRAYPITHDSLPPQTVRITLNGSEIASLTLAPEWRDYEVQAQWHEGMNELAFEFARVTAPSALDPDSSDRRELAASFDWIAVDEPRDLIVPPIRLDTSSFLDRRTAWRNTRTHFPVARLRRDSVEALLARLGFDPQTAWPQIASGEVHLDDVVETIAYGSCEDARTFVHRAFAILLERSPAAEEEREVLALERVDVVSRIVKSDEFRARVLR